MSLFCYLLHQLGTGEHTQKAQPKGGIYPKPRERKKQWPIEIEQLNGN